MKSSGFLIRLKEDYQSLSAHSEVEPIMLNPLYAQIYPVSRNRRRELLRNQTKKMDIPTTIRQPALRNLCYAYKVLKLEAYCDRDLLSALPNQNIDEGLWNVENVAFVLACSEQTARSYVRTFKYLKDVDDAALDLAQLGSAATDIEGSVKELGLKLEGTRKRAYKRRCRACLEKGKLTKFITKNNEDVWLCPRCTKVALEMIENRKKRGEG